MRRAAAAGAAVAAALASLLTTVGAHAANPSQDYALHCMGCHGTEAQGVPGKVPPLANALRQFMRTAEGRNYVLRVPGAANSALSDEQLAAVLNWLAVKYDSNASAKTPSPFTTNEVAALRHQPLLSVLATRSAVVHNLATTGSSPPSQY
ncbi:MAG: cytochrome c [Proteobacteria bacterium]|nr:cytochrome c [Pseudomonadota bacterium]